MDNNQNQQGYAGQGYQQNAAGQQYNAQQQYNQQQYDAAQNAAQQQYYQQQYEMQQQYYQQMYAQQQAQQPQQDAVQQQYAGQQDAMQQQYSGQQGTQQYYQQQAHPVGQPDNQYNQASGNGTGGTSGGGKKKTGLIIGIIAAVVILVAVIITIVVVKNKKKDKDDKKNDKTTEASSTEDTDTTEEDTTEEAVSNERYFSLSRAYDKDGNDYTDVFLDYEQSGMHSFVYLNTDSYTGYVYMSGDYVTDIDSAEFDADEIYLICDDFSIILKDDKITFSDNAGEMILEFTEISAEEYAVIDADTFGGSGGSGGGETVQTGEYDYVPDNPILYDDDVLTIEIANIHKYEPDEHYKEDALYRWDLKITNNRKKGGIYVDFMDMQYNNVVIGGKHLNNDAPIGVGQTREISLSWLEFIDNYRYFGDAASCKFTLHVEDDEYNTLYDKPIEFYANGAENDASAVPDLSAYTPFLEYEGMRFYITDTYLDEDDYIMMEGFLVNDSDVFYYLEACYNDDIYVNGVAFERADRIHMGVSPHTTSYFQGWIKMEDEYGPENGFNISIPYTIRDYDTYDEIVPEQQYSFSMPYKKEEAEEPEDIYEEYDISDW